MRLLADENFPRPLVEALRGQGHDVLWARTDCSGWRDAAPLEHAESEARILLTLDRDFWQIAVQRRKGLTRSGVVWFRAHPATPRNLEPLVNGWLQSGKPWAGYVSIITADGIQMLALPGLSGLEGA